MTASKDIDNIDDIRRFAVAYLRREQDLDLQAFGLKFDNYFLESSLYTGGSVDKTVRALTDSGHTYEHEGALWLRTTDLGTGDDKDRVMRKSDGSYTYFVPDVAYHVNKWERGFHHAVNIRSEEHTSELPSLMRISYAVFCLKKKTNKTQYKHKHRYKKHRPTH